MVVWSHIINIYLQTEPMISTTTCYDGQYDQETVMREM